jgi:hypothetical protein
MKFTSLSKTFTTVGLMATLSVVALLTIAKTAQSQIEGLPEGIQLLTKEQLDRRNNVDDVIQFGLCNLATQEHGEAIQKVGEPNLDGDGYYSNDSLRSITLTDTQQQAYDALNARQDEQITALFEQTVSVEDPTAILSFVSGFPGTVPAPPEVEAAIQAELNLNPGVDQVAALNRKYENGKYGIFEGAYVNYLTPEQEAQLKQIENDFYSGVQALLTPEQLPQYNRNLPAMRRFSEVCAVKYPLSRTSGSGRIIELPDDAS